MKMNNNMKNIFLLAVLCIGSLLLISCDDDERGDIQNYPTPTVTGFFPKEGLPSSQVTITGTNFGEERVSRVGRVYFNGIEATDFVSYSDTEMVVKVPDKAESGPITVWVWKNNVETAETFNYIPGAEILKIEPAAAFPGETVTISGVNFHNIDLNNIKVDFNGGVGTTVSATSTEIEVIVPTNASSGPVTVIFEGMQTVVGPSFSKNGEIIFNLWDYLTTSGSIIVDEAPKNGMGSTRSGAYVIYAFTVPVDAKYDASILASTNQSYDTYVNLDMGTDATVLGQKVPDNTLSQKITKQGWNTFEEHSYGPFILKAGVQYYVKLTFMADDSSWVANVGDLRLTLAEDQSVEGINVGGGSDPGYKIYKNNFNTGTMLAPFTPAWAFDPNYIKVQNQYLEFYYNQAALDADNRRERRGAEVVCDFATYTEGWYGFKIFLPEGQFPKNVETHIAQIFQHGSCNSWTGFLSIKDEKLQISRRNHCGTPVVEEVAAISWDTWIPIIIHFKASWIDTGMVQVWVGDASKNQPTYNATNINFGFGEWVDGETLDAGNHIGCKFGMYCSEGGDRIIRFDDLSVLEGNPNGAYELVKPGS